MAEPAFVTGGSGFIGGKLVQRLVAEGRPVRALARSDAAAERVAELGAAPVRGELGDPVSLTAGADGAGVAFHLAAHLGEWGAWKDFERGNVVGTRNVLAACEEAGVDRFVHCGTDGGAATGPRR
jgi:nucleoside-diphosphate-sugar epimerase